MLRYFKKQAQSVGESIVPSISQPTNLNSLPVDPSERKKIESYNPNERDAIRRAYLQKGPCQPRQHNFPQSDFGGRLRRFNPDWFDEYKYWLEYSIKEDVAFCLCCYLFKPDIKHEGSPDSFSSEGFKAWNKKPRLGVHEGSNAHKLAVQKSQNLMNQSHSIRFAYDKHAESTKSEYRVRLNASVDCTRFLLRQGLPFRGHDESVNSRNKGNFLELLQFYEERNEKLGSVVLSNAPGNEKMIASSIQKEIVHAAAKENIRAIIDDLNDDYFGIIVDESRDVSCKEQMALILCYVDRRGSVVERFLGLAHVSDTSAISLKNVICSMLSEHNLSLSRVRGQGYDGASNMRGEFNGLKTLVMRETKSAYYVHCFAHQLQVALVFVAKKHVVICDFFDIVNRLLNVIGASCKRRDKLREQHRAKVIESLDKGEIQTGRGLNQELSIKRPGDTRWGSHYASLLNIMAMYFSIIDVLEDIEIDGNYQEQRAEAHRLLQQLESFDFIFCTHLMVEILGITNELNLVLQKKDQEIVNVMSLVKSAKERLQNMRDGGWESLMKNVSSFCSNLKILIPSMEEAYVRRVRNKGTQVSNLHHYQVDLFYAVIDMQLQELNCRFNEVNMELLLCMACLSPKGSFDAFDKEKLLKMATFYSDEFSATNLVALKNQLDNYTR